jgi:hypothetical protein
VTAGVTYDSMIDVPTQWVDGGNGSGNYAVANPVNAASGLTVNDGNLKIAASAGGSKFVNSSIALPASGAYYAEITCGNATTNLIGQSIGVQAASRGLTSAQNAANAYLFYGTNAGVLVSNTVTTASGLSAISANEVFQIAVDVTNSRMWIGRSNVWYNSTGGTTGNPSTGANPTFTAAFVDYFIYSGFDTSSAVSANFNFGQRPFTYTPPTGFVALNTLNLPAPTILKGNQYFDTNIWSGQNTSLAITNSGSMQPDFVWIKKRNAAADHNLVDVVRGTNKNLISNSTAAEDTTARLTSFNSNGFTLAGAFDNTNISGSTYVGWQWKAGGTAASNTNGTITSTVSASPASGFSIVRYTGTGAVATVGHGLGAVPRMIILRAPNVLSAWVVYHASTGNTGATQLQSTGAFASFPNMWNNTTPTSSVFTVGTDPTVNTNGAVEFAYCFAPVAGFSAFGSYIGNGSADGTFVYTGFRPEFVMIKRTDSVGSWWMLDSARDPFNLATKLQRANENLAEETSFASMDILSNGFKLRVSVAESNANGGTYIYMAFAENPFKNALAR